MSLGLVEVSTYEEARYAVFSGDNADRHSLTKNMVYQIHQEDCYDSVSQDFYVVNDKGQDSFTSLKIVERKLYK